MDTINHRIAAIVAASGCTKTDFAKHINLTQSMISKLCSGAALPSERTIADICRVFGINEQWLRTGNGEMLDIESRSAAFYSVLSPITTLDPTGEQAAMGKALSHLLAKQPDNIALEKLFYLLKQMHATFLEETKKYPQLLDAISPEFINQCESYINMSFADFHSDIIKNSKNPPQD